MVINTHYKFIFVHIPKAAGVSIMKCLSKMKGHNTRWLAKTKHETLSEFYQEVNLRRNLADRILGRKPQNYFRFGFVRNPWDRMSSFYRYLVEKKPRKEIHSVESFKDFLLQVRDDAPWIKTLYSMKPQVDYFTLDDNTLHIDFLGHFEHLGDDLRIIAEHIGSPLTLPHLNRSTNSQKDYRKEYDSEMIEIVARRFTDDIHHFGYTFDQPDPTNKD